MTRTRRSTADTAAIKPKSPVVQAIVMLKNFDWFCGKWLDVADITNVLKQIFELETKHCCILTQETVNRQLNWDPTTKHDGTLIGIHRDTIGCHQRYAFLCPQQTEVPKYQGTDKWSNHIISLKENEGCYVGAKGCIEKHPDYTQVRSSLIEFLDGYLEPSLATKSPPFARQQQTPTVGVKRKTITPDSSCVLAHQAGFEGLPSKQRKIHDEKIAKIIMELGEDDEKIDSKEYTLTGLDLKRLLLRVTGLALLKFERQLEDSGALDIEGFHLGHASGTSSPTHANARATPSDTEDEKAYFGLSFRTFEKSGLTVAYPNSHDLVAKNQLSRLRNEADIGRKIIHKIQKQDHEYYGKPAAKRLYATVLQDAPYLSYYQAEQIFPGVVAAWLADAGVILSPGGVSFDIDTLVHGFPCERTLSRYLDIATVDHYLQLQDWLDEAKAVYLACDKGQRKGIGHFPKILSWWSPSVDRVRTITLDANGSGGSSEECGDAVELSKKKMGDKFQWFAGQITDSGGGGVLYPFKEALRKRGLTDPASYFVAACTLHALQMAFANPVKLVLGEGGIGLRNVMQLLHSCYDLEHCFEPLHREMLWKEMNPGKEMGNMIAKAVLTRWWWVNKAAEQLDETWVETLNFAHGALNVTTSITAQGKIASSVLSLMQEKKIETDLALIIGYTKAFFVPQFKWLQKHDPIAKDYGYLSRHMAVRTYIIYHNLKKLSESWESHNAFRAFVEKAKQFGSNETAEDLQVGESGECRFESHQFTYGRIKKEVSQFFDHAIASIEKHFIPHWIKNLLHFVVAGEKETARAFCMWVTNGNTTNENNIFKSEFHETDINLEAMIKFFGDHVELEAVRAMPEIQRFQVAITKLASKDVYLWDQSIEDADIVGLRQYALERILPLPSSTHRVEAMVRECSHASATNRGEEHRSNYVFLRSFENATVNRCAAETYAGRKRHANQHMSGGEKGKRDVLSPKGKKKHGGEKEEHDTRDRVRGNARRAVLIQMSIDNFNKVKDKTKEERETIATLLHSEKEQARFKRAHSKFEKEKGKAHENRKKNVRERTTGVDLPLTSMGAIPWKMVTKALHFNFLLAELEARDLQPVYEQGKKNKVRWQDSKDRLKEAEPNPIGLMPQTMSLEEFQLTLKDNI